MRVSVFVSLLNLNKARFLNLKRLGRVSGNARVSGKLKIDFVLCSRFSFEFDWQINAWKELEKEFEEKLKKGGK